MANTAWTQERLAELVRLWPTMNRRQLADHFGVGQYAFSQVACRLRKNGVPLAWKGRASRASIDYSALAKIAKESQ